MIYSTNAAEKEIYDNKVLTTIAVIETQIFWPKITAKNCFQTEIIYKHKISLQF